MRYKLEQAASVVKVNRYGGQNSWWAASNVEGVLKLQCTRGVRTLRSVKCNSKFGKTRASVLQQSGRRPREITIPRSTLCVPALLMCSPQESASIPHFGLWCNPAVHNFLGCPKFKQPSCVLARREHQSRKKARRDS